MYSKHVCTLKYGSESNLPPVSSCIGKCCRALRKLTIASPKNKQCHEYFRSYAAISMERSRHVQSNLFFIIHPFSIFRLYWEFATLIVLFLALILNPLDDAFKLSSAGWKFVPICILLIDIICFFDILMGFFTGYGKKITKEVVLRPRKIAKREITNPYFYLEVVACVPMITWFIIGCINKIFLLRASGVLKIVRIRRFLIYYSRTSDIWQVSALANTIILYSILAILLLHWTGCLFYTLPSISVEYSGSSMNDYWIGKYMLLDYPKESQYVRCIFKAAMILFNVHDRIFYATTTLELVMCIFTFIIGKVYMACMLVLIIQMMASKLSAESKYQEILNQVQEYMRYKQMPISMQKRLIAYYEYRFQKKYFRENLISGSLSTRLRREINVYCYRRLIENVSIFKEMPRHLVVDVVNSLKEEIFLPNDIIVKAHTIGDCMYFIASGSVCVTTPTGKEICHLYDGAYFGEVALLMKEQQRIANVFALETCEIYRLDRKHFRKCFLNNTDVYKTLEKVANVRLEKTTILEDLHKKYLLSLENC